MGTDFRNRDAAVIPADVLDAWFAPEPGLLEEFRADLPFLIRTAPPTGAPGVKARLATHYGLAPDHFFVIPGSSRGIHLILTELLPPGSTMLRLEPTYSEYAHVAENLPGVRTESFLLPAGQFPTEAFLAAVRAIQPTVIVLVNPNNPTGTLLPWRDIARLLPADTHCVIDEAYLEYTSAESAVPSVLHQPQLTVIKSLSKVFGLSGVRLGFIAGARDRIAKWETRLAPWEVSTLAQWWGCQVWDALPYYRSRWNETSELRETLVAALRALPGQVLADAANWVLWESPRDGEELAESLARDKVFVRRAWRTARSLSDRTIRIAVRPAEEQERLVSAIARHTR